MPTRGGNCHGCRVVISEIQCTEGWECNLGLGGLEKIFADNGLWGFLGPNWKVFHHGTLSEHFWGVVTAFGSGPSGEKWMKSGKKSI